MHFQSRRASVLLPAIIYMGIVLVLAGGIMQIAMTAHKLSKRNDFRTRAQAVAESELEYLYFQFKEKCLSGAAANTVPALLTSIADNAEYPSTNKDAFLAVHRADNEKWRVRRSIITDREPINGNLPNSTKTGQYTYINARIEVLPPLNSPYGEDVAVRIGRRFINSTATIFQYSIFYQGDLEITPGGDTVINGDVAANGNLYLGVLSGKTLTINNKIRYPSNMRFNKNESDATYYYNPNAPAPAVTLVGPSFGTSEASQVSTMDKPENLLGGLDAGDTVLLRPNLFAPPGASTTATGTWTTAQTDAAINNVYRSVIVPPPSVATTGSAGSEYPHASSSTADDPAIEASRAYTRADVVVTVASNGAITVANKKTGANLTTPFTSAINILGIGLLPGSISSDTPLYDQREAKNVQITNIDVARLTTVLQNNVSDFNGVIYFNLKGASSTTPAAIRLLNAEKLPNITGTGFSVATNGGLYVQGSYNTKTSSGQGSVPAMLMSDSLTVLSAGWNDANASSDISDRIAESQDDPATTADESALTNINAGLLTGNVASTDTVNSGGAQNLIRYLEDWTGSTVAFNGSIGRLFQSRHFASSFPGPGQVYLPPKRVFSFDESLANSPPPGSPTTTEYSRGNFFVWSPQ